VLQYSNEMDKSQDLKCAVIGYGYWGPHLARNLQQSEDIELIAIVDRDSGRRNVARKAHRDVSVLDSLDSLFEIHDINVVVIATPAETHFELAKFCINMGCHVLVEKPLTTDYREARQLVELAASKSTTLMVDHTFLYSAAVQKMQEMVVSGQIGELVYFDSHRVNLGLFQPDVSVLWDLAVHDLSILFLLVLERPILVSAVGGGHEKSRFEAAMFITLKYASGFFAHINVSWLSPMKMRQTVLSGSSKTILFDDMKPDAKLTVFEAGVDEILKDEKSLLNYRLGDVTVPRLLASEPLRNEIIHFVSCIRSKVEPLSSGSSTLPIIKVLEAASLSNMNNGKSISIDWSDTK